MDTITFTIKGQLADHLEGTQMASNPQTPDELAFKAYWDAATVRRYGKGYRMTFTAPMWVMNWVADYAENLPELDDVTKAELKAVEEFLAQIPTGKRNAYDGPTKEELVEAGLVEGDKEEENVETMTKGDQLRQEAADLQAKAQESYDRCDTDGALSQWCDGLTAAEKHLQARIEDEGGTLEFPALFDLEGNLVPAKRVHGRYGSFWSLLDENGKPSGETFNESQAKDEARAIAADAKKGFYVGTVRAACYAKLAGGSLTSLNAVAVRKDGGWSPDVEVIDNGQEPVEEETVETAELVIPKGIRFEDRACPKCGGVKAYNPCRRCHGKGRVYTKRGAEAMAAYQEAQRVRLGVAPEEVQEGDVIRLTPTGPWSKATGTVRASSMAGYVAIPCRGSNLQVEVGTLVMRHSREECARIMHDVAAQYPGATVDLPEEPKEERKVEEPTNEELEAMVGTLRTDHRGLRYRVEGLKWGAQSNYSPKTVTVWGRCIEDKPQEGNPNATWHGAYCAEVYRYGLSAKEEMARKHFRAFEDGEGGLFVLEVHKAVVVATDRTPEGEETTETTFKTPKEAEEFVATAAEEMLADGWTEKLA